MTSYGQKRVLAVVSLFVRITKIREVESVRFFADKDRQMKQMMPFVWELIQQVLKLGYLL